MIAGPTCILRSFAANSRCYMGDRGYPVCDEEYVISDKFRDQVATELWRYLERVHPQTEQHLDDVLDVVVDLFCLQKFLFVVRQDRLREHLAPSP